MNTRPKTRSPRVFTLADDTFEVLRARSAETDIPMSRLVDRAIRRLLGLPEPTSSVSE